MKPHDDAESRLRAFFALDPGPAVRDALTRHIDGLCELVIDRSIRWVSAENMHLTLRFLGDVRAARLRDIEEAVRRTISRCGRFEIQLTALTGFPTARRPRVIVAGIAPQASIEALAARIEEAVVSRGEAPELRLLRPHITLGRIHGRPRAVPAMGDPLGSLCFEVRDVVLYRSLLGPSGATYRELARLPLSAERA